MGIVVNTNTTASLASSYLGKTHSALQDSINRLSSGQRIIKPSDDAGGLAVSERLTAAIRRTGAVKNNVDNAVSFLQSQDGAMQTTGDILNRMSELKTLYSDELSKSDEDKTNYDKEFNELKNQLGNLKAEKFNGVDLFKAAKFGDVIISEDGAQKVSVGAVDLDTALTNITGAADLSAVTLDQITTSIGDVANLRAQNGSIGSRLKYASDMLITNKINLESANSMIRDTDIAAESANYAKLQILSQAGGSMLAQANTISQSVLQLIR